MFAVAEERDDVNHLLALGELVMSESKFDVSPIEETTTTTKKELTIMEEKRSAQCTSNGGVAKCLNRKQSSFFLPPKPLKHYLTREVLPHVDHYRNRRSMGKGPSRERPTLEELLEERQQSTSGVDQSSVSDPSAGHIIRSDESVIKFGWFDGVYMRCLLNIWGVMLFLRLTWVIGQAGLISALGIITLSNIVTLITSISMSAVSTNGQIRAGGIYYMISRSLGPEFGGAIGLMFTVANAVAVAMYLIGFCEALLDMLSEHLTHFQGLIDDNERINDVRLIGSIALLLILALALVGMDWVTRVQMGLLVLLVLAQVDFVVGTFLSPTESQRAKGFVGYNLSVLESNLWPEYESNENFFTVFAVFFPAVTGIVAGANLSGDLKDPATAIPKGTLLAIATTYVTYIVYGIMTACCSIRHASGHLLDDHALYEDQKSPILSALVSNSSRLDACVENKDACLFGLIHSQQMLGVMSAWAPLISLGCFAATLSSAIASLVGAPRVFQAVAKDKLFPFIDSFGQGYGKNKDPIKAYVLVFVLSLVCVLVGDLNYVSSLLSNFFVAAYALINFSVFHASVNNMPGWRPSFKYYNRYISLLGTVLCITVMFLMDSITALATFLIVLALYVFVKLRHLDINWGSSTQSQTFMLALQATQNLNDVEDHVKTYRPKLIVFVNEKNKEDNMRLGHLLTKRISLMHCVQVMSSNTNTKSLLETRVENEKSSAILRSFYSVTRSSDFGEAVRSALELTGIGKLSANTALFGLKDDWQVDLEGNESYCEALRHTFDLRKAIVVYRPMLEKKSEQAGFIDVYWLFDDGGLTLLLPHILSTRNAFSKCKLRIFFLCDSIEEVEKETRSMAALLAKFRINFQDVILMPDVTIKARRETRNAFKESIEKRSNDNLTITKQDHTETHCDRHDSKGGNEENGVNESSSNEMSAELSKSAELLEASEVSKSSELSESAELLVSSSSLASFAEKTNFHLRLSEIVSENSSDLEPSKRTQFLFLTLPVPKKSVPAALYLAWINFIAAKVPNAHVVLVRGNQDSVLTFYS